MENLYQKYTLNIPRYTSYPAIPYWNKGVNNFNWLASITNNLKNSKGIDLYIHIPYCQSLCWYCGCNRVISKNQQDAQFLVWALKQEWEQLKNSLKGKIGPTRFYINSIHLGGGTPNFLQAELMNDLLKSFISDMTPETFIQVELDPRTLTLDQILVLQKYNATRASLGIQDFDPIVQKAINRVQPFGLVQECVKNLREHGFTSINFDLIFGLPHQSVETIEDTIFKSLLLSPDQISFYSYAHLPDKIANQKLIKSEDLVTGLEKRSLYERGKVILEAFNFFEIGLDHFAKKDSYLYKSYLKGNLKRTFMGHTDKKSDVLIGLGPTSISNTKDCLKQNTKDVKKYLENAKNDIFEIEHGHFLQDEDAIRSDIIQKITCLGLIHKSQVKCLKNNVEIFTSLEQLRMDGIIRETEDTFEVTKAGKVFVRNICSVFDEYLYKNFDRTKNFSSSV